MANRVIRSRCIFLLSFFLLQYKYISCFRLFIRHLIVYIIFELNNKQNDSDLCYLTYERATKFGNL